MYNVLLCVSTQIYAAHNTVRRIKTMEKTQEKYVPNLAWVVLSRAVNGRSEVIKVTNHEEADLTVLSNPELFYKSGPVLLS